MKRCTKEINEFARMAKELDFSGESEIIMDICPDCGKELEDSPGGGVQCTDTDCAYWLCL